jgi:hypothetical protein
MATSRQHNIRAHAHTHQEATWSKVPDEAELAAVPAPLGERVKTEGRHTQQQQQQQQQQQLQQQKKQKQQNSEKQGSCAIVGS